MNPDISHESLKKLFTEAHTHYHFHNKPVSDEHLREIYNLARWAPTSFNCSPMRVEFCKSAEAKEKLLPTVMAGNVDKVKSAPVTAIIAFDEKFYDYLPKLFPAFDAKPLFANNPAISEPTAFRNGSLQGAYFILAARAYGLDCGPMSGFDNAKVDEAFFKGTSWKSNFLCNLGYGDPAKLYPRSPRFNFDEACKIV